jgi:hypothetical protein
MRGAELSFSLTEWVPLLADIANELGIVSVEAAFMPGRREWLRERKAGANSGDCTVIY